MVFENYYNNFKNCPHITIPITILIGIMGCFVPYYLSNGSVQNYKTNSGRIINIEINKSKEVILNIGYQNNEKKLDCISYNPLYMLHLEEDRFTMIKVNNEPITPNDTKFELSYKECVSGLEELIKEKGISKISDILINS